MSDSRRSSWIFFEKQNKTKLGSPSRFRRKSNQDSKYEKEIEDLSNEILKKISYGIDEFNIKISKKINLQEYIKYILNKETRNKSHIILLRYYLSRFSSLLESMNLSNKYYATKEILNKIAIYLKKEEITKNTIIFYNGQIGKTFYIILEGEVSILIPSEYNALITMEQYLEYLKYLYKYNEYELLHLSYESNKELLKIKDCEVSHELENFDYCFEKVLQINTDREQIDVDGYIKRFDFLDFIKDGEINYDENNNEEDKENDTKKEEINDDSEFDNNIISNNESSKSDKTSNYSDNSIFSNFSIIKKKSKKKPSKDESEKKSTNRRNKYSFSLWKYVEIIKLGKGQCFGEIALQSTKNKRTATIITTSDCFFGTLEKDQYQLFVKEILEKIRKNNIERLLNTRLFKGVSFISFDVKLFNCFTFSREEKGAYLFKRGEQRSFLTYIKKGEIQLEIIANCRQLDNIILLIGGNPYDHYLYNLIKTNKKMMEFINIPKKFNISIFSQGDIIGTDELAYLSSNVFDLNKLHYKIKNLLEDITFVNTNLEENCFLFNAVNLTGCEIFKLDLNFLKSMLKDKLIRSNYEKLLQNNKERLIERLKNMKTNIMLQYYHLINNSDKSIEKTNNLKSNSSFSFNKRNMINKTQFLSLKNINVVDFQSCKKNNKIDSLMNIRNNSFLEEISKNKGKTKDFFYPEQNIKLRNDSHDLKKNSLLTSFMNNSKYKVNYNPKLSLSQNNYLHKYKSDKNLIFNNNRTYYKTNKSLKQIALKKII